MAYDSARQRIVLFGGKGSDIFNDTWEWDGTNWTEIIPTTRPEERSSHAMAYDPFRNKIVMYGGVEMEYFAGGVFTPVWEWDGVNWVGKVTQTRPGARGSGSAMTYDGVNKRVIMFQ
jgi:hypothetical protein